MMSGVRAWLEMMRLSNLPTVWSNVLHGLTAGFAVMVMARHGVRPPLGQGEVLALLNQSFMLMVGMSLIYAGGMVLNDVCDAGIDAAERPTRAIPGGRVRRSTAGVVAALMLLLGAGATLVYGSALVPLAAGVLVLLVVGYNLLHGVRGVGLVLMPLCRGMVIVTAALAYPVGIGGGAWVSHVAAGAVAVALYTGAITLVAWSEVRRRGRAETVGWMIAAMPLVDAGFLGWLGAWPAAGFCVVCAALTAVGQRWVAGS